MSVLISALGIVLGIGFVIVTAFKGYSVLLTGPIAALVIAATAGIPFSQFMTMYSSSYGGTMTGLIFLYLSALIFAEVLKRTDYATSIAYWVGDHIGVNHVPTFCLIATAIMAIGGMFNATYFIVYPIGMILCSKGNWSRGFLAAACVSASWSFAIVAPFVPSSHNGLITNLLGVDGRTAGLVPALVGSIVMLVFDIIYLEWYMRNEKKKGKGFEHWDLVPEEMDRSKLPSFGKSMLPLILVMVLYNIVKLPIATSLFIAAIFVVVIEFRRLQENGGWFKAFETGAKNCAFPTLTVAAMAGIGGILGSTPAFQAFIEIVQKSTIHPYILIFACAQVIGFATGGCSGGITTSANMLGGLYEHYVGMGYSMENMARLTAVGAAGLSSGPHSGGFFGVFEALKTNHAESYKPILFTCVIGCSLAGCIEVALMMMGL